MIIGKLKRRITIQKKTVGKDAGSRSTITWTDLMTIHAAWEPLRSREFFAAAAVNAENTARYRIRYRKGITPAMRIVDDGRIFEITGVLEDIYGDRTQTHLMCKELVPGGG